MIYQISYDLKDGQGCRPEKKEGWFKYPRGKVLDLGLGKAAGQGNAGSEIPRDDERDVCLYKYSITNKNKIHDLRVQRNQLVHKDVVAIP